MRNIVKYSQSYIKKKGQKRKYGTTKTSYQTKPLTTKDLHNSKSVLNKKGQEETVRIHERNKFYVGSNTPAGVAELKKQGYSTITKKRSKTQWSNLSTFSKVKRKRKR